MKKVYIGADHGGYKVKETIKKWLKKNNIDYIDVGTNGEESTDYPIFAEKVGKAVAKGLGRGILICKSGQGMSIAANKINGVRASVAWNSEIAQKSREHNDSNIICLPGSYVSEDEVISILKVWLETPFSGESRHAKRLKMVDSIR